MIEYLALLRTVSFDDLEFHAARFDSGASYQALVVLAMEPSSLTLPQLRDFVRSTARRCVDDGANYGSIPCLGGRPLEVWERLLGDFGRG